MLGRPSAAVRNREDGDVKKYERAWDSGCVEGTGGDLNKVSSDNVPGGSRTRWAREVAGRTWGRKDPGTGLTSQEDGFTSWPQPRREIICGER